MVLLSILIIIQMRPLRTLAICFVKILALVPDTLRLTADLTVSGLEGRTCAPLITNLVVVLDSNLREAINISS